MYTYYVKHMKLNNIKKESRGWMMKLEENKCKSERIKKRKDKKEKGEKREAESWRESQNPALT